MREKIPVTRLEVGMHVESLCGKWLEHPFWRTRFVVRNERDLAALKRSGVVECWIDRSKSVPPAAIEAAADRARELDDAGHEPAAPSDDASRAAAGVDPEEPTPAPAAGGSAGDGGPIGFEDEIERAAAVCVQAARATESLFREARLGRALELDRCGAVAEQIAASATRNPAALVTLARVRTHHGYTFLHSVAVCALMTSLARQLGFDEQRTQDAALAGLLHDIGKAGIAREILDKPGRLSDDEFDRIREHPAIGNRMLRGNSAASDAVLLACLHHHERWDGNGYPGRLVGDGIPLVARMTAICDVYDAITSQRAYKVPWDPAESLLKMAAWTKDGQFDPAVFRVFANTIGIYPVGSLVRMQSDRLAVVVDQNRERPAHPHVKVFWSTRRSMPICTERIDLSAPTAGDRIVARESNEHWGFRHLPELLMGEETYRRFASG